MQREELVEQFFENQRAVLKAWKVRFHKHLGENSLTHAQLGILHTIHHEQPISGHELAAKMQISPSAVTQLIDALDQAGLIERCENEADRRITNLRLSEQGDCKVREFEAARHRLLEQLAAVLTDDELRSIVSINAKMIQELEK